MVVQGLIHYENRNPQGKHYGSASQTGLDVAGTSHHETLLIASSSSIGTAFETPHCSEQLAPNDGGPCTM